MAEPSGHEPQLDPEASGYLKIYTHEGCRVWIETYYFYGYEDFVTWPDWANGKKLNDELSCFKFMLPRGWSLRLFKDRVD